MAEFVAGLVAGLSQSVVAQPFDFVKTRMQASATTYRSTTHCIHHTLKHEGLQAFYRGFYPSALSAMSTSALRFGVQGNVNQLFAAHFVNQPGVPFCELTFHQRQLSEAFGGGMAGAVLPLIMTPMELIKVQRQVLHRQSNNWAVAKDIYRARGIRGLYTGHSLTTTRAMLGNTMLFGTYGLWKKGVENTLGLDRVQTEFGGDLSFPLKFLCGVLAGWSATVLTYPVDCVKTRTQSVQGLGAPRFLGLWEGLKMLARERALYRGFSSQLLRFIPAHGVYLPLYDVLIQSWKGPS